MSELIPLVEVALDLPLPRTYHYRIPETLKSQIVPGKRLLVPLGKREVTGYALGFSDTGSTRIDEARLKEVIKVLDLDPLFDEQMLRLFRFAADYYFAPLGIVLKTALPAGINVSSRKLLRITEPGRAALKQGLPKARARELLEALLDLDEVLADRLDYLMDRPVSESTIRGAEKKGWIAVEQQVQGPRVSVRTERGLEPGPALDKERVNKLRRRAPEQIRLLDMIAQLGPTRISDLRTEFIDPARLAARLVEQGLARFIQMEVLRSPYVKDLAAEPIPERLMEEQAAALSQIEAAVAKGNFATFLMAGITGSGKTEVYLRAIQSALALGKQALVLVPEIALTPQLISRFRHRFPGEGIAVQHSGLGPGERFDQWLSIHREEVNIVIGARSAVFAPLKNPGLIVVDEEHEAAYKQDEGFTYHARDLAVYRAMLAQAVIVLGSATPSVESMYNAVSPAAKYRLLLLPRRIHDRPLPRVEVVDMRQVLAPPESPLTETSVERRVREMDRSIARRFFSPRLHDSLLETVSAGDQAILFLNRRGFASILVCLDCGNRFTCPNCQVSLTAHKQVTTTSIDEFYGPLPQGSYLLCHHCGYHQPAPDVCPKCKGIRIRYFGLGTERVEKELREILPQARIARMDADTMSGHTAYFDLLEKLRSRQVDLLIGTQMVAKGHDLPGVTLVGVLLADTSLNQPDFRAGERTFQILTQVAGRAGRGDKPGRVIIQTFNPHHYAVELALPQDYRAFYEQEVRTREELNFPPFSRLVNFRISAANYDAAKAAARRLAVAAKRVSRSREFLNQVSIMGPASAPLSRLRGKSRFQMLARAAVPGILGPFCRRVILKFEEEEQTTQVRITLDRDPQSLL